MKLYLINKNPIISKLVALSVSKLGVEMEEAQEINSTLSAQIVLIDDECFEKELFDTYKAANPETKFCLFYAKSSERLEGFDEYIQKPFLPTDLVKTLSKVSGITPIESQPAHKASDEALEVEGVESLENSDGEVDLSSFDNLPLDDEESTGESTMDSNSGGNEQLDSNTEEGVEKSVENSNVPLDFGIEEDTAVENPDAQLDFGAEEEDTTVNPDENPNAQLDFGADDGEEDNVAANIDENPDAQLDFGAEGDTEQTLKVLDKEEVEEIKDLFSDEETSKQTEETESLEEAVEDLGLKEDLDLGDLQNELDNIENTKENKEETLESQEESLSLLGAESAEVSEDSQVVEDFDFSLDGIGGDTQDKAQDFSDSMESEDSKREEVFDLAGDLGLEDMESKAREEENSLETASNKELQEEILGLSDLDILEDISEEKSGLDSLENLGEATDSNDSSGGGAEEQMSLDMESQEGVQEESNFKAGQGDFMEAQEESNLETEQEDLGIPQDLGEAMDLSEAEEQTPLDMQPQTPNIPDMSNTLNTDEFDSLSLEAMSEALGEPIAKAPNTAPIVSKTSEEDSTLPSNIQANSLESLIAVLQALDGQNLKDLLSGATLSINIQFPKKD